MLCSPENPDIACYERAEAERDGSFYWEPAVSGWVRNNHRMVYSRCPWCDGDLCDMSEPEGNGHFAPVLADDEPEMPWGFHVEEEM